LTIAPLSSCVRMFQSTTNGANSSQSSSFDASASQVRDSCSPNVRLVRTRIRYGSASSSSSSSTYSNHLNFWSGLRPCTVGVSLFFGIGHLLGGATLPRCLHAGQPVDGPDGD